MQQPLVTDSTNQRNPACSLYTGINTFILLNVAGTIGLLYLMVQSLSDIQKEKWTCTIPGYIDGDWTIAELDYMCFGIGHVDNADLKALQSGCDPYQVDAPNITDIKPAIRQYCSDDFTDTTSLVLGILGSTAYLTSLLLLNVHNTKHSEDHKKTACHTPALNLAHNIGTYCTSLWHTEQTPANNVEKGDSTTSYVACPEDPAIECTRLDKP